MDDVIRTRLINGCGYQFAVVETFLFISYSVLEI